MEHQKQDQRPLFGESGSLTDDKRKDERLFGTFCEDESDPPHYGPGYWRFLALIVASVSIFVIFVLGVAALVSSDVSNSSAEFAFAFDAFLGLASSGCVVWRFYKNLAPSEVPKKEKKACLIIAVGFILSAVTMFARAVYCLVNQVEPTATVTIIVISTLGFLCYSLLFFVKFKVAQRLHSVAMRTDSFDSASGAVMAFGVLVSTIIYKHALETWWLDPVIAMVIAMVTFTYGLLVIIKVRMQEGFGVPEEYEQF